MQCAPAQVTERQSCVPEQWRGSLPMTYHVGPSTAKAHLVLKFNWDRKPLYDVVARIPGSKYPDQWVLRGNHHDAWVNGAGDPVSGVSPELEEARSLGELLKQGWKPERTIPHYWPLLLGWRSTRPAWLDGVGGDPCHRACSSTASGCLFQSSDGNGRGYFRAQGSHSLENFVNGVTKDIVDPETKMTVWKRERLVAISRADAEARTEVRSRPDLRIGALGSGSDYTVFIDHLGVASVNLSYGGEDESDGQYHSIYDDFYWYTHFQDTDFVYGRALAQTAGTMVMRMADADVIPYQFTNLAETVHGYVAELKKLASTARDKAKEQNTEISEDVYKALYDPKKQFVPPTTQPLPPYFNFAPLEQALRRSHAGRGRVRKSCYRCWRQFAACSQ